ncbi:hypothetical protein [Hoeflea sp.]|uniref:hypothetical protein n=1 Tax=Hoeflea sp. TaxID=1940281 RepID=UPI003B023138
MISIIIACRNDNYGGDFEERLFATCRYNVEQLRKRHIDFELVFVEWNPLSDTPLLSEKIAAEFREARCIVVDPAIHNLVSENRHIKVFEYHAKNAGARRANGDWLLATNPDNFFGDTVLDFFAAGEFDADTLYRAGRIDIADESGINDPGLTDDLADGKALRYGAPGDFIFCSKDLFYLLGGFREDLRFTNSCKDLIFCLAAEEQVGRTEKVGITYHLEHVRTDHKKRRNEFDWRKVERTPQETFGLAEDIVSTTDGQITRLSLPDHLLRVAEKKLPVDPIIPQEYYIPLSFWRQPRRVMLRLLGRR